MSKKICIVAGARPNFIKVAPVMRAIENARNAGGEMECKLVYTGREDDETLEDSLFSDLGIRKPDVYLGVECENMNELTGMVMAQFERYLQQNPTDVVIVVDDLVSTMAVSIVTKKQGVQLAHIAAGTRSFDITMPKEINRLVIDGLSDILFTAGISNNSIANKEGAELSKVYMVGNVLIDNIRFLQQRMKRPQVMDEQHLEDGKYMVLTLNRKAIVNNIDEMKTLISTIDSVARQAGIKVLAPLRGKALGFVLAFKAYQDVADHQSGIMVVQPQGTFNGVPCITLNSYTEHQETVTVGTNELVAEDPEKLQQAMEKIVKGEWKKGGIPDRWDGRSAERIVQIICG